MSDERRGPGRRPGPRGTELLAIAREVFLERGYTDATMHEVAARARISKASLYREHPSKDHLFVAVVEDWAERGRGAMRPVLDTLLSAGSLREGLTSFARTLQAAVLDDAPLRMRRLVAAESGRFPEVAGRYVAASWDANIHDLGHALAELASRDLLDLPDARLAAEQLTWMTLGAPLNAQTLGGPKVSRANLDALVDAAVESFLRAHGTTHTAPLSTLRTGVKAQRP